MTDRDDLTPEERKAAFDEKVRKQVVADNKARKKRKAWVRAEWAVDTLRTMARAHQIDDRQLMAVTQFREAFDAVGASIGGALDPDKIRGAASGSPPPAMLAAADTLLEARHMLGEQQFDVVAKIIGSGMTISECTATIHGKLMLDPGSGEVVPKDRRRRSEDRTFTARLFRDGLTALADAWVPQARSGRIRTDRQPDAKPVSQGDAPSSIERGHVVHASSRRIVHGGR